MNFTLTKNITRTLCTLMLALLLFCGADSPNAVYALDKDTKLVPGGVPFGVKLYTEGVCIIGLSDVRCEGGSVSPARAAGLTENDVILEINSKKVMSAADTAEIIANSGGEAVKMTVRRGANEFTVKLTPVLSSDDNKYRAGILIRDGSAGIGTVTYVEPQTGKFAGLGHGICESGTDKLAPLSRGAVVNVAVSGISKGKPGAPGELKGYFSSGKIGTLFQNTECGVYGVFAKLPDGILEQPVNVASSDEICVGDAQLWCTVDNGGIGKYAVKITDIDHSGRNVKNFVVTVTDPALLEKTGGIVQGMSGSPILQNGKLVGALTHVLVNDPTKGYGIFIENMLDTVQDLG